MNTQVELLDTFNVKQLLANLVALVALALLPYLVYMAVLIFQ
jgi:hypothetical protein